MLRQHCRRCKNFDCVPYQLLLNLWHHGSAQFLRKQNYSAVGQYLSSAIILGLRPAEGHYAHGNNAGLFGGSCPLFGEYLPCPCRGQGFGEGALTVAADCASTSSAVTVTRNQRFAVSATCDRGASSADRPDQLILQRCQARRGSRETPSARQVRLNRRGHPHPEAAESANRIPATALTYPRAAVRIVARGAESVLTQARRAL